MIRSHSAPCRQKNVFHWVLSHYRSCVGGDSVGQCWSVTQECKQCRHFCFSLKIYLIGVQNSLSNFLHSLSCKNRVDCECKLPLSVIWKIDLTGVQNSLYECGSLIYVHKVTIVQGHSFEFRRLFSLFSLSENICKTMFC